MIKESQRLSNRTVLITGASSGLGEQIAYEASKNGARVILCARREEELKKFLRDVKAYLVKKGCTMY